MPNRTVSSICLACTAAIVLAACDGDDDDRRRVGRDAFIDVSRGASAVCGTIAIDIAPASDSPGQSVAANEHVTRLVRSDWYASMEDNDLRGFLDGTYKEGWNQVSQTHLRLGRRRRNPGFGEYELFRNLQRWDDLPITSLDAVTGARITLTLESGPPFGVDVAVYAVRKDWNPGAGGVNRDNNSPPAPGEVWWRDARSGEVAWSVAGAGHASDSDPAADTAAEPLAIARYAPGDSELVFESRSLAGYVENRLREREPLLLLYKLLDPHEDSVGSVLEIWSANFGIDGSPRRPSLEIRWQPAGSMLTDRIDLVLEPGRHRRLGTYTAPRNGILATTFRTSDDETCGQTPFLEYRSAAEGGGWHTLPPVHPISANSVVELRATAAERPVALGGRFSATIRDTWIPVGAPEEHSVLWTFRRPDGSEADIEAAYFGDYTWRASIPATMLGRWEFQWRHSLSGEEIASPAQHFDVVAWELAQAREGLRSLLSEIRASGAAPRSHAMLPFELRFMRLERAAVQLAAAETTGGRSQDGLGSILRDVREALSGKSVPTELRPRPIRSREAEPN